MQLRPALTVQVLTVLLGVVVTVCQNLLLLVTVQVQVPVVAFGALLRVHLQVIPPLARAIAGLLVPQRAVIQVPLAVKVVQTLRVQ